MISGECRVEPIGLSTGHQLALDGLRLRLDLRIVAGTAADGSAEAVWRVEDGRIRTLSLNVPAVYRRAAMLAGLGVLAVALLVWFAGSRAPSEAQAPALTPGVSVTWETDGNASSVGGAGGAASASEPSPAPASPDHGDVAPRVAPLPPAAQLPAPVTVEPAAPPAPAAAETVRPPPPSQPARPRPAAPSPALTDREMLDLFSDPK
jgi:hypothetical protein